MKSVRMDINTMIEKQSWYNRLILKQERFNHAIE